jgi:DNA-binding CsgD family transcriptional regulator
MPINPDTPLLPGSRMLEALQHRANGLTMQQTADTMTVEYKTVNSYMTQCQRKLRSTGTVHTVAIALREGLIK